MDGPRPKYVVTLSADTRQRLERLTRNGSAKARKILHARILLMADQEHPDGRYHDTQIGKALGVHANTVAAVRRKFVLTGEHAALERKVRLQPPTPPKLDGAQEAALIALCCSPPPQGRTRWTMRLLTDELIRRRIVVSLSVETVRKRLKKTSFSPGGSSVSASPSATRPALSPRWKKSSMSTPSR